MAPQCSVESVDLFPDRQVPDSSQQVLQRHETAPQARFLGAHPNPEVALQVPRAVEREPQKVDRFWALPTVFGGMLLREPAKFDQLGLGRFEGQAKLSQPFAQGVLDAKGILSILETHYKVVDVPDHVDLSPQPGFDHALEP
jgi:hypothetical protein